MTLESVDHGRYHWNVTSDFLFQIRDDWPFVSGFFGPGSRSHILETLTAGVQTTRQHMAAQSSAYLFLLPRRKNLPEENIIRYHPHSDRHLGRKLILRVSRAITQFSNWGRSCRNRKRAWVSANCWPSLNHLPLSSLVSTHLRLVFRFFWYKYAQSERWSMVWDVLFFKTFIVTWQMSRSSRFK